MHNANNTVKLCLFINFVWTFKINANPLTNLNFFIEIKLIKILLTYLWFLWTAHDILMQLVGITHIKNRMPKKLKQIDFQILHVGHCAMHDEKQ